jgi:3-hydroxyacyl-CoA dehydrogenase / enoyl-CoA hydratase / 3-hydroxybutyryl-CoA epimerase
MYERNLAFNRVLRQLETCGKPVVAAINGTALGGGLEICLACHHRIAADNPKALIGLPEAQVGVLPGGGGTQRLPRMIGAMNALPLMLEGKTLDPQKAKAAGIVNDVVPADQLLAAAKKWIKEVGTKEQPWDKKDFKVPGGGPHSKGGGNIFTAGNAMLMGRTYGNYPAQRYIMSASMKACRSPSTPASRSNRATSRSSCSNRRRRT